MGWTKEERERIQKAVDEMEEHTKELQAKTKELKKKYKIKGNVSKLFDHEFERLLKKR